jgi:unsaturated rhamnogalacturonyl hydrolase
MLLATEATGDQKYADYTNKRLKLIADIAPYYKKELQKNNKFPSPVHGFLMPHALDDGGAVTASMIKAQRAGLKTDLRPLIDDFMNYISTKEFRLTDGTLARNRPQPNTLWLDDMFMAVPALAQMGKLTGDVKYYDDAVKQVKQFSERMFNSQKGLYMHGWVQSMEEHPQFHWARANGWAVMTMVELLEVLPKDHPGYKAVLNQLRAHIKGLVSYQDGTGFWHQLIDRNDTYLETSATAIYAYSISRAINRGYIDKAAYAPAALLAWNAVATKVNDKGEVEGTCVGTGMGFDPAFYYYRPINVFAAHGYGPVILAGSEIIMMLKNNEFEINDSSLQLKNRK